jgi:hypothetical protein
MKRGAMSQVRCATILSIALLAAAPLTAKSISERDLRPHIEAMAQSRIETGGKGRQLVATGTLNPPRRWQFSSAFFCP